MIPTEQLLRSWLSKFFWKHTETEIECIWGIGSFHSRSPKSVNEGSFISLRFSPFVTINEISISWKFQLHTYYQSIFVTISNFWLFRKNCKIWMWANFRGQFLENWILRSFQPQSSPESVPGSAKIISWTFGIRKNISFEISKKC